MATMANMELMLPELDRRKTQAAVEANHQEVPEWATYKDRRDFKKMLEDDDDLMFDGIPLDEEDKKRIKDVLTGLFWEAKQMNKRKKSGESDQRP